MRNELLIFLYIKKGQKRNKKANSSEGIIRLALIILWAIVVVVLGLYGDSRYHTTTSNAEAQNTSMLCGQRLTWHVPTELGERLGHPSRILVKRESWKLSTPVAFFSLFGIDSDNVLVG